MDIADVSSEEYDRATTWWGQNNLVGSNLWILEIESDQLAGGQRFQSFPESRDTTPLAFLPPWPLRGEGRNRRENAKPESRIQRNLSLSKHYLAQSATIRKQA